MTRSRRHARLSELFAGEHSLTDACRLLSASGKAGPVSLVTVLEPRTLIVRDLPRGRGRAVRVGLLAPSGPVPSGVVDASALSDAELLDLDVLVAHPAALTRLHGRSDLAKRGLMPMGANRTLGLDAPALAEAYRDTRVWARVDKAGNLSLPVGSSASASDLEENVLSAGLSQYRLVGHSLPSLRVA